MITTRIMTTDDYNSVYELRTSVQGIGLNDVGDSFDGFKRYIERNPDTSFVAPDRIKSLIHGEIYYNGFGF